MIARIFPKDPLGGWGSLSHRNATRLRNCHPSGVKDACSYSVATQACKRSCENSTMSHTRDSIPNFIYGTAWKEDRTASLTELAIRSGFRAIDTANQRSTTSNLRSARDWLPHTAQALSPAPIFFYRRSSPIRQARTIACPTILPQRFPFRWRNPWPVRLSTLAPTMSIALFSMAPLLTPTGPQTILKPGRP